MKVCDSMILFKNNDININKKEKKKKKNKNKKVSLFFKKLKKKFCFFEVDKRVSYSFKEVVIIMLFSLGLGFFACFSFVKIFSNGRNYKTLTEDFGKLVDTYYAIKENYYGELNDSDLVDAAIKGMVEAVGDVYTSYTDIDATEDFMQTVSGVYEGIGCTVSMDLEGRIIVIDMFKGSPAEKYGMMINDIIIKIDDVDYIGKTSTDMSNYVRNSSNSEVKITVLRGEEEIDIVVKREKIEIPYVDSEIIERDGSTIGYINISLFSSVVNDQFEIALKDLEKKGIDSLIIDVRGNTGGYLSSVTDIINLFLEKGKAIYQLEDNNGVSIKNDTTKEKRNYPVAVLVNGGSASASEILAAAIKESYGGFVVGTNTYGKGTVQQTTTLPDGSMVKYTIQNWLTPNGNWINEIGLEPTDFVELDKSYLENPTIENDKQLQKAIELLIK